MTKVIIGTIMPKSEGADIGYAHHGHDKIDLERALKGADERGTRHSNIIHFIKLDGGWQHHPAVDDHYQPTELVLEGQGHRPDIFVEIVGDDLVVEVGDNEYLSSGAEGFALCTIESWVDCHWVDPVEDLVEEAKRNFPSLSEDAIRAVVHANIERYQNALRASRSSWRLVSQNTP
jgi:hypothetical protein